MPRAYPTSFDKTTIASKSFPFDIGRVARRSRLTTVVHTKIDESITCAVPMKRWADPNFVLKQSGRNSMTQATEAGGPTIPLPLSARSAISPCLIGVRLLSSTCFALNCSSAGCRLADSTDITLLLHDAGASDRAEKDQMLLSWVSAKPISL